MKHRLWDCTPVFHVIGRWAYGLANTNSAGLCDYKTAHANRKSSIEFCAYMNLKKTAGKRKSVAEEIKAAADRYQDLLREQIKVIAPDVVVCGGTYKVVKEYLFKNMKRKRERIHEADGMIFINAYHPSYYKRKAVNMYNDVVNNYYQYILHL